MTENPYRLARDIRGIGFKTADTIAMKLGIEKMAMIRVRARISYALTAAMNEGTLACRRSTLSLRAIAISLRIIALPRSRGVCSHVSTPRVKKNGRARGQ